MSGSRRGGKESKKTSRRGELRLLEEDLVKKTSLANETAVLLHPLEKQSRLKPSSGNDRRLRKGSIRTTRHGAIGILEEGKKTKGSAKDSSTVIQREKQSLIRLEKESRLSGLKSPNRSPDYALTESREIWMDEEEALPTPMLALRAQNRIQSSPGAFWSGGTPSSEDDLSSAEVSPIHNLLTAIRPCRRRPPLALVIGVEEENQKTATTDGRRLLCYIMLLISVVVGLGVGLIFGRATIEGHEQDDDQPFVTTRAPLVIRYVNAEQQKGCESNQYPQFSPAVRRCLCKQSGGYLHETAANFNYNARGKFSCFSLSDDLRPRGEHSYGPHRDLLLALFEAWTGNGTRSWTDSTGWNTTAHECDWFGVTCTGERLETKYSVVELRLPNNNLSGDGLPKELFWIKSLRILDLSFNELDIPFIPMDIVDLVNLETLDLSSNGLQGSLPLEFFPKTLKTIRLSNTFLMSSLPTQISYFRHLEILEMSGSGLVGSLPTQLGLLRSLQKCILNNNELTGELPTEISGMTMLEHLDLDANELMSTRLPSEIGNLVLLEQLNMNNIRGAGALPTEVGRLTNLKELRLMGQVAEESEIVPEEMMLISGFGGSLPTEIGLLLKLEVLDLANNAFLQQIPTEFGQLTLLKKCDLSFNDFSGSIPNEIAALTSLQLLRLRGTVSVVHLNDTAHSLSNLTIPASTTAGLISGEFPVELANLDKLFCLDTIGTLLTVPESICDDDGPYRYINVDCGNSVEAPCSCCICDGPDYCDII